MSAATAECLPEEVVAHILSFLPVYDQQEAALSCRKWYVASLHPDLQRRQLMRLTARHFSSVRPDSSAPGGIRGSDLVPETYARRPGVHLALSDIGEAGEAGSDVMERCQRLLGPRLLTLSLRGCDVSARAFSSLIVRCTNLETLDISTCDSIFISGTVSNMLGTLKLPHLAELNLSSLHHLSDLAFSQIMRAAPNITTLSLASNKITCSLSSLFYSAGKGGMNQSHSTPNSVLFTLDCLLEHLLAVSSTLVSIDLSHTDFTDDALSYVSGVDGLFLRHVRLRACKLLTNRGICTLSSRQTYLETVDLGECPGLGDAGVVAILSNQPRLRELTLDKCRELTGYALSKHLSLVGGSLVSLSLKECYGIKDDAFTSHRGTPVKEKPGLKAGGDPAFSTPSPVFNDEKGAVGQTHTANATSEVFEYMGACEKLCLSATGITHFTVLNACRLMPQLTQLDLSSCGGVTNQSVCAISASLPRLTQLSLSWCRNVSDFGLLGLPYRSPRLDELTENVALMKMDATYFHSSPPVRDIAPAIVPPSVNAVKGAMAQAEYDGIIVTPLSRLRALERLSLSACVNVTDTSLTSVLRFSSLREVDLEGCYGITDASLFELARFNPCLETVNIGRCTRITDAGIKAMLKGCKRLRRLVAFGCCKLTDDTVTAVRVSGEKLKYLDLSMCALSPDGVESLQEHGGLNVFHHRCATKHFPKTKA